MRELQARQSSSDQLWHKLRRTYLDELHRPGNQFCVTDGRLNGEEPAGAVQAPLIGDIAFVEVIGDGAQRNGNTIRGRQQLEVGPDVLLEVGKTLVERKVLVEGEIRRMGIQGESAQRSPQPEEFGKQLCRVRAG